MSDFDDGLQETPELVLPGVGASRRDYEEALKQHQQLLQQALRQNKDQELEIDKFKARAKAPGRKKRDDPRSIRGEDTKGYLQHIPRLGKAWCLMYYPFAQTVHFGPKTSFPLDVPRSVFRVPPTPLFHQYVTAELYRHVPEQFHNLVDSANYPDFAGNYDLNALESLFLHPGDKTKVSLYLPILYPNLKKGSTIFCNRVLPMTLRGLLFGPASLGNDGKRKPQGATLGYQWKVVKITFGSIAFTCTAVVFVLFWMHNKGPREVFEEQGATSKISFLDMFLRFRCVLETQAESPGMRKVLKYWHGIVFEGVTTVTSSSDEYLDTDVDEVGELEEVLAGLDVGGDMDDENENENGGMDWYDEASVELPRPSQVRPSQVRPAQLPVPPVQPQARPQARPLLSQAPPAQASLAQAQAQAFPTRPLLQVLPLNHTGAPRTGGPRTEHFAPNGEGTMWPNTRPAATDTTVENRARAHDSIAATPHLDLSRLVPTSTSTPVTRHRRALPPPVDVEDNESPIRVPRGRRVHFAPEDDGEDDDAGVLSSPLSSPPRSPRSRSPPSDLEYIGPNENDTDFDFVFDDKSGMGYEDDDEDENHAAASTSDWLQVHAEEGPDDTGLEEIQPAKRAPAKKKAPAKKPAAKKAGGKQAAAKKTQEKSTTSKRKTAVEPSLPVDPEKLPYSTRNRSKHLQ
ncbi:hypothetical protein C8R43DRAFT_953603 [Mycena crocata]|nr:hypothetical protein C8R43DRAFT_953603 [Mycena crocata]